MLSLSLYECLSTSVLLENSTSQKLMSESYLVPVEPW